MWVVRSTCTDKVYFLPQIKPNSTDWLAMAPSGLKRSLIDLHGNHSSGMSRLYHLSALRDQPWCSPAL